MNPASHPSDSPRPFSDEELDAIDAWCDARLAEYAAERAFSEFPCEYTDLLPTHSIRSQMASLVAEVRRLRSEVLAR